MLSLNKYIYIMKMWLRHRDCGLANKCLNYNKFEHCGNCWRADGYRDKDEDEDEL